MIFGQRTVRQQIVDVGELNVRCSSRSWLFL